MKRWQSMAVAWAVVAMAGAGCGTPGAGDVSGPGIFVSPAHKAIRKIAVMPLKAPTELIGTSMSELVANELMRMGRYEVVERSQLSNVLKESEVALSGLTAGQAAELGQMLGADGVVIGTVSEYENVAYRGRTLPSVGFAVRLIDCKTGKVQWSVDHVGRARAGGMTLAEQSRRVVREAAAALARQL